MSTKCNCNNCSVHIEFEENQVGQTVTCPACGMETKLYNPKKQPQPRPKSAPKPHNPFAQSLAGIRVESCYKTLRGVIDFTFILAKALAGLFAVLSILGSVLMSSFEARVPWWQSLLMAAAAAIAALVIIGLLHAAHQASLLLVDIADCNIRLVAAQESRSMLTDEPVLRG